MICVYICECVEFVFTIRLMCFIHDWRANRELALSLISLQSNEFLFAKAFVQILGVYVADESIFLQLSCVCYCCRCCWFCFSFSVCLQIFVLLCHFVFDTKHIFCTGFITLLSNMFLFWFNLNAAYSKQQAPQYRIHFNVNPFSEC